MARLTKAYLVGGVFCLALGLAVSAGIIDSTAYPGLTVALPAGAVGLGLFFICYIFENEAARFDAEQRALLKPRESTPPVETTLEDHAYGRSAVANH